MVHLNETRFADLSNLPKIYPFDYLSLELLSAFKFPAVAIFHLAIGICWVWVKILYTHTAFVSKKKEKRANHKYIFYCDAGK